MFGAFFDGCGGGGGGGLTTDKNFHKEEVFRVLCQPHQTTTSLHTNPSCASLCPTRPVLRFVRACHSIPHCVLCIPHCATPVPPHLVRPVLLYVQPMPPPQRPHCATPVPPRLVSSLPQHPVLRFACLHSPRPAPPPQTAKKDVHLYIMSPREAKKNQFNKKIPPSRAWRDKTLRREATSNSHRNSWSLSASSGCDPYL